MRAQNMKASFKPEVQSYMSLQPILTLNKPRHSTSHNGGRKSNDCWEVALQFAHQCRNKLKEGLETIEDLQTNSTAALEMLAKRQALDFTAVFLSPSNSNHVVLILVSGLSLVTHALREQTTLPLWKRSKLWLIRRLTRNSSI